LEHLNYLNWDIDCDLSAGVVGQILDFKGYLVPGFPVQGRQPLPGDIGGSVSFSAVYDPAALTGQGVEDLKADWLAKTVRPLVFGGTVIGDKIITVQAWISKFSMSAKHADKVTADVTFQITGAIVFSTITV